VQALRGCIEEHRNAVYLAALMALLALGAAAPPALGAAALGQLYAFGRNYYGQLGNETNLDGEPNPTPAPVSLPGEVGPVTQAATGAGFSLVVTAAGQLYAFGRNYYGQLGNEINVGNIFAANPTPTLVTLPGATGPVIQVAAGMGHSLVVTATGQLYAFGYNWFGQLGNANNNQTEEPNPTPSLVTLPGASGPVIQVAAGGFHSLALTATGQLYAFGDNNAGQLGTATSSPTGANPTPTLVALPGATGPVTKIAAGEFFSLAVTATGQLYAFGENHYGQLGNATNNLTQEPNPTPSLVTLQGEIGPVIQIAAGISHSLALTSTGQLYAFGENRFGELGSTANNLTEQPNPTPSLVTLPSTSGPVTRIAAGDGYSLALTSAGELYAFGRDYGGELGTPPGNERDAPHPAPTPVPLPGGASIGTMATGPWSDHTLVVSQLGVAHSSLPAGEVGVPYSALVQGIGGGTPYTWAASGLPQGLSINRTSGAISGTPTATGSYTPTITLTDSYGIEASMPLTITINTPPSVRNETLPAGEVGVPYSALVQGIGGGTPYTWAASGLPQGLSINRTSGAISGTPTATGSYTPTITLTDSYGIEASMPLTITINTPPSVRNETLPSVPGETMLPSLPPKTPPAPSVQNARQSAMRWREGSQLAHISLGKTPTGTTFSFSLNEQATVSFSFTEIHGALQGGHSCVATIHKDARRKKNVRRESCSAVTAATLSFSGHSGPNSVLFAGRISRTSELQPGRYKLVIIAANFTGQRSTPVSLSFTITA
jgi:alpha-tubulin suppressor-like RCC1 family protein